MSSSNASNASGEDPLITLANARSLVFKAIALAEKGLLKNPSQEEERALNRTLAKLELERTTIQAKIEGLIAQTRTVVNPTVGQVQEISNLTAEVAALTNASITASGTVALTSRILTLATEVAAA